MASGSSPVFSQNMTQNTTTDCLQTIIQRLDSMDSKLSQLNKIQSSVSIITERLSSMESKIRDIEQGHSFVSSQYDGLYTTSNLHTCDIGFLKKEVDSLKLENSSLKSMVENANESVIDLKCRSMRDNCLFWGIPEGPGDIAFTPCGTEPSATLLVTDPSMDTAANLSTQGPGNKAPPSGDTGHSEPSETPGDTESSASSYAAAVSHRLTHDRGETFSENCESKVFDFCKSILLIKNPENIIRISRAHRVGVYNALKTRPIVAKFVDTKSKMIVMNAVKRLRLDHRGPNVTDQYPQEVNERRRQLIPIMKEARRDGQRANLVRDKLYINNKLYTGEILPQSSSSTKSMYKLPESSNRRAAQIHLGAFHTATPRSLAAEKATAHPATATTRPLPVNTEPLLATANDLPPASTTLITDS
jgi:TolA-binding protein